MYSYYMVEESRRAYERYLRTGDPEAYITFITYYDLDDLDYIPRNREVYDLNPKTSPYTVDYLSETYEIGSERMRFYPFL